MDNVETVGAMMSSASGAGSMDMTSMMTAGGGEYDVTAYITLPEGASGAEAGKQMEAACAGMDCTVSPSGAMDTYMSYLTGSGITLNVYGDDMEQMQSAARDLAAKLATVPRHGKRVRRPGAGGRRPAPVRGPQRRHGEGPHRGPGVHGRGLPPPAPSTDATPPALPPPSGGGTSACPSSPRRRAA